MTTINAVWGGTQGDEGDQGDSNFVVHATANSFVFDASILEDPKVCEFSVSYGQQQLTYNDTSKDYYWTVALNPSGDWTGLLAN
jgi:hypothetical protein